MKLAFAPAIKGQTHKKKIRIVGEKYDNRQAGLAKLFAAQEKGKPLTPELQEYKYENSPAVRLLVNGVDVGVFLSEDGHFYYDEKEKIVGYNSLKISHLEDHKESADGEIKTDKNGNPIVINSRYKTTFSLTVRNANPITQPQSIPPVPSAAPDRKTKRWQFWK